MFFTKIITKPALHVPPGLFGPARPADRHTSPGYRPRHRHKPVTGVRPGEQSNGNVAIAITAGGGTAVTLYLPRVAAAEVTAMALEPRAVAGVTALSAALRSRARNGKNGTAAMRERVADVVATD